jgi:hypothetical protein
MFFMVARCPVLQPYPICAEIPTRIVQITTGRQPAVVVTGVTQLAASQISAFTWTGSWAIQIQ